MISPEIKSPTRRDAVSRFVVNVIGAALLVVWDHLEDTGWKCPFGTWMFPGVFLVCYSVGRWPTWAMSRRILCWIAFFVVSLLFAGLWPAAIHTKNSIHVVPLVDWGIRLLIVAGILLSGWNLSWAPERSRWEIWSPTKARVYMAIGLVLTMAALGASVAYFLNQ